MVFTWGFIEIFVYPKKHTYLVFTYKFKFRFNLLYKNTNKIVFQNFMIIYLDKLTIII